MTITADKVFWGFIFYVKNNPFKSIDNMTENDFDAMVKQFAAVNVTNGPITAAKAPDLADYYGYGTVDISGAGAAALHFPKKGDAGVRWALDNAGVDVSTTYALNMVALKSASYPEEHLGE